MFFIFFYTAQAQKEAAIWYFGENAGLDFNSGSPVALTDGQLVTDEGCAVISDSSGRLLFYTDGMNLYNRVHQVMQNGTGLNGHISSTNSAIIVPKPGSPSRYYIFTTDAEFGPNGMQDSEVNMDLDNGMGGVTATKNILLEAAVSEKLTAIKIPGENAYYVLTHKGHSDEFLAYKISESGVNSNPVRSGIGPYITWPGSNSVGQIKFSPDGKKLGVATENLGFELYDFNSVTGKVSNYHQILSDWRSYGVEFSPSSDFLYTVNQNFGVSQYNLRAGSPAAIVNSEVVLQDGAHWSYAMQLAIDGKIYITTSSSTQTNGTYISVINNPNEPGLSCNFEREVVSLDGKRSTLGLPPFIQSLFHISGISAANFCHGDATSFTLSVDVPVTGVHWDFGDGSFSSLEQPTHRYTSPGNYEVKVTVVSGLDSDSQTKSIAIYPAPEGQQIPDINLCIPGTGSSFDLSTLRAGILGAQPEADFGVSFFFFGSCSNNRG